MLARAIAVSLPVVAALLVGCGGSGRDEQADAYVSAVNAAQTRFSSSVKRISGPDVQPVASTATVDRLNAAVERVERDLRAVEAPDRVDRLHERLIDEVRRFGVALRRARTGLRSGDRATILAQRSRLTDSARRATREIEATIDGIDRELRS